MMNVVSMSFAVADVMTQADFQMDHLVLLAHPRVMQAGHLPALVLLSHLLMSVVFVVELFHPLILAVLLFHPPMHSQKG